MERKEGMKEMKEISHREYGQHLSMGYDVGMMKEEWCEIANREFKNGRKESEWKKMVEEKWGAKKGEVFVATEVVYVEGKDGETYQAISYCDGVYHCENWWNGKRKNIKENKVVKRY